MCMRVCACECGGYVCVLGHERTLARVEAFSRIAVSFNLLAAGYVQKGSSVYYSCERARPSEVTLHRRPPHHLKHTPPPQWF